MSHLLDADNFEELAELAVSFLEQDLGGERTVVVHGDDQHTSAVVQLFSGFSLKQAERLDAIEWEWQDLVSKAGQVVVEKPSGLGKRAVMAAPLQHNNRSASGFLYVERSSAFTNEEQRRLQAFADAYLDALWKLSPAIRAANRATAPHPGASRPAAPALSPSVANIPDSTRLASSLEVLSRLKDVWEGELELPPPNEVLRHALTPGSAATVDARTPKGLQPEPAWSAQTPTAESIASVIVSADGSPWSQFQGRDLEMMLVDWY